MLVVAACGHPAVRAPAVAACHAEPSTSPDAAGVEAAGGLTSIEGRPIRAVEIVGAPALAQGEIARALGSRLGEPLAVDAVRRDLALLVTLGFATAAVRAGVEQDGVALAFVLTPLAVVSRVTMPHRDDPALGELAALTGSLADPIRIERVRRHALERWRSTGYLDAAIEVRRSGGELCVMADPGRRYVIEQIEVVGGDALPRAEVVRRLGRRGGTVNAIGARYDAELFKANLDALALAYMDLGYSAEIHAPVVQLDRRRARVAIRVSIDQGTAYRYGVVEIPWPAGRAVAASLGISTGRRYSAIAVDRARERLRLWGEDHGIDVRMDGATRATHEVDLKFSDAVGYAH
ncbi:MAG: hypothetical protein H6Q90_4238 [Deltaproteobacteria bacterium]|nr:hypothetical protein [Deltaproteobacteria bacterium]